MPFSAKVKLWHKVDRSGSHVNLASLLLYIKGGSSIFAGEITGQLIAMENGSNLDTPYALIDGAASESANVFEELQKQYSILADKSLTIEQRLNAFELIIDSEIGDTSLIRAKSLERELSIRQLFLKFEGGNPTGTQKDRIAFAQCQDALRRGFDALTLATCGNYGVACALAAKYAGLKCVIFIPDSYQTKRIDEMQELGAEIRREPGDYEDSVAASQLFAETSDSYDANPGGKNTSLQLRAYGEIAKEIYDELRDAPRIVAAPVSNGTMLAGIYKGFLSLYRRGKTSRMPLIVAGSAFGKNPIILAYLQQKQTCEDLDREQIKETSINEPLVNWHSFDGDLALEGIYGSHGWAANVSDQRMVSLSRLIREKEGLMVLPASTAGLAALLQAPNPGMIQNDRFVVILTSRK